MTLGRRLASKQASDDQAQIAHLKLQIAKLQRQLFGPRAGPARTRAGGA